jgi:hypothetical protein
MALSGAQLRSDVTAFIAREHAPAQQLIDVERQRAFDQLRPWSLMGHVWTAPTGQGIFGSQLAVGCKSCVRPVGAALIAAGLDVIRRSGPYH